MEFVSLAHIRLSKYAVSSDGQVYSTVSNTILTPKIHRCGYLFVRLERDDGVSKNHYIHRLVALTFLPNPEGKDQVNHIDGIKTHNYATNLEWTTNRENVQHAMDTGLWKHWHLTDELCHQACRMLVANIPIVQISAELNVPYDTIYAIKRRQNWTHISSQYALPEPRFRRPCLTEMEVHCICAHLRAGTPSACIADIFDTSLDNIRKIASGAHYPEISKQHFE